MSRDSCAVGSIAERSVGRRGLLSRNPEPVDDIPNVEFKSPIVVVTIVTNIIAYKDIMFR